MATGCNPQFPLYVVSKGRHESRLTIRALEAMGVSYHVVVEEQFDREALFLVQGFDSPGSGIGMLQRHDLLKLPGYLPTA